ncbi:MAG: hypothetical protein K2K89_06835 [Ruminococcus sp.]|nr:hypothetical protein [Ruminococcus sp.]
MNNSVQQVNGSVLRTLNVISGGRCSLSGLEYIFSGVNRCRLLNSLKYLDSGEYIKQTGNKENPDISLTGKGVLILRGFLDDDCIEV